MYGESSGYGGDKFNNAKNILEEKRMVSKTTSN